MNVHLFGATSSPGCANYALQYLVKEYQHIYPMGWQFILRNFDVDDGLTSIDNVTNAIQLAQEAHEICAKGGLRLHKFMSDNKAVMQSIPSSECASKVKDLNLAFLDSLSEKTLGIQWNIETDCFRFSINLKNQPDTRRGVLATVAPLYNPFGLVAPFLLTGKKVLQEMCRKGSGRDDPLPDQLRPWGEQWKADLVNLEGIKIRCSYVPHGFGRIIKTVT